MYAIIGNGSICGRARDSLAMSNARLEVAFSATRREDFLGDGPRWMLRGPRGYITTPDVDPVYTDDLVGILPERHLNNGQPSLQGAPAVAGSFVGTKRRSVGARDLVAVEG